MNRPLEFLRMLRRSLPLLLIASATPDTLEAQAANTPGPHASAVQPTVDAAALAKSLEQALQQEDLAAMIDGALKWDSMKPSLEKAAAYLDQAIVQTSADVKRYRAQAEDGTMPEKTAALYRQVAENTGNSLKRLVATKAQLKSLMDQLTKTMDRVIVNPDVSAASKAARATRSAEDSLRRLDEASKLIRP
jgi:hypothetical protein